MKKKLVIIFVILLAAAMLLTACTDYTSDKEVVSIQVENFANYSLYQGDELDLTSATILVTYNDGTKDSIALTDDMISGYDRNSVGEAKLTIAYKKVTATVNVEVKKLVIQSVAVDEQPESIVVVQGGDLDLSGVTLKITYQNKTSILGTVTESMLSGYSSDLEPGEHEVYVVFSGFRAPITINVVKKSISYVKVTTDPSVKNYFLDEDFNPAGMAVTLYYNNNTEEVVYYSSETLNDFEFSYDFSIQLTSSPVTVTYKKDYMTMYYASVAAPVCTNLEFSYSESVLDGTTGESSLVNYSYYPVSYGVYIDGVRQTPNPITALVEGDKIDWSSGKARLTFDDGSKKIVSLSDTSINIQAYNDDLVLVSYREKTYSEPGNYILYVSYGNMDRLTPLYVTVKAKRAIALYLYNTESVTQTLNGGEKVERVYSDGDKVTADLVRYNVLYDNGTYLCNKNDYTVWAEVTVEMLADDSDFTVSSLLAVNGYQRIGLTTEGVSNAIYVRVAPVTVANYALTPPSQDVVLKGSFPSLSGGYIYVEYSNGATEMKELTAELMTYSFNGEAVTGFSEVGTYTATVAYNGISDEYTFEVADIVVTSIEIGNPPSSTPTFGTFDAVDFSGYFFNVTYSDPDADPATYPATVPVIMDYLYACDVYNTGYQEVTFRYGGALTTMAINVTGRYETYIQIIAAPHTVYGLNESFNYDGLIITKYYNDGTRVDVRDFSDTRWVFVEGDNSTVGKKQLSVTYNNALGEKVGDTLYQEYNVVTGGIDSISIDTTQAALSDYHHATEGDIRVLKVTKNETLNTTGLMLTVTYTDTDGSGNNIFENIVLDRSYITYDRNNNAYNETRALTVTYGNKTTTLWIQVIDRALTAIEVVTLPTIHVYAEGQEINLAGGELRRTFGDGTTDTLPMQSGLVSENYNPDYFATHAGNDRYVVQTVTVSYGGLTANMNITTYRRTTAENILSYSNTVSFYGNVKTPIVSIVTSIENFVAPDYELFYYVGGEWVANCPSIPGSYPLKVVVFDNEYYKGSVIQNQKMVIIEKIIEIRADDATKVYGQDDPQLSYAIEGDGVDADGNPINTILVWNEVDGVMVQDIIQIRLVRVAGEDVLFSGGAVVGYKIGYELVAGNNQNDRYRIDFYEGEFKITQMEVTETVTFSGWQNLIADGNAKVITASFARKGSNIVIAQSDMIYSKDGVVLEGTPWEAGTYTVTVSDNYRIVNSSNYCVFTINDAT